MSILASLNHAYDRMAEKGEVPSFGFSSEKISFVISLNADGSVAGQPIDIRDTSGKKPVPPLKPVPQPYKRTAGIKPNYLWDKSSYVLGITAAEGKRLADEHKAFKAFHAQIFADTRDEGLLAVMAFLNSWTPDQFECMGWNKDILDQNIVFALESERHNNGFIHDRPAAKQLWAKLATEGEKTEATCLVTGENSPIARLHPSIKGVWGGQSSGGAIVSFNLDAFASYGHEQGDNAPVSEAAAFGYTTALNKFLEKDSDHRIQIGDASVVFWADAPDAQTAQDAEDCLLVMLNGEAPSVSAKRDIKPILDAIAKGQPTDFNPNLNKGVRFYVLGLAPNAARLSIRFWYENDFGQLAKDYQRFLDDMRIEPPDKDSNIALWKYLREVAVLGKAENVPPNLAGEWMRSILMGTPYPLTLLNAVLMRFRSDAQINARRISILKSILIRNKSKEAPVAFDPNNTNKGYLLGRLFAVYEHIQAAAMDYKINASVKDKYYASASVQPRKVFGLLESASQKHLSKIGKKNHGQMVNLTKAVTSIMLPMSPNENPYPISLSLEEQALFGLGYYHQRNEFFKSKTEEPAQ